VCGSGRGRRRDAAVTASPVHRCACNAHTRRATGSNSAQPPGGTDGKRRELGRPCGTGAEATLATCPGSGGTCTESAASARELRCRNSRHHRHTSSESLALAGDADRPRQVTCCTSAPPAALPLLLPRVPTRGATGPPRLTQPVCPDSSRALPPARLPIAG
jgi:hypothetical protein